MSEEKPSKKNEIESSNNTPFEKHIQKEIDPKSFCSISTLIKTNTLKAPFPVQLKYEQLI